MTPYRKEIETAARAHGLDPDLVEAVVMVESSGRTSAYRYEPNFYAKYLAGKPEFKGMVPERISASYGLMQVLWVVAREMGFTSNDPELLFVPSIGLAWGCKKLGSLIVWAKGDVEQALAAYNGGKQSNEKRPFRNAAYASRVISARSDVVRLRLA